MPRRHLTLRIGKSRRRWRVNRDALAGLCDHARRTITIWPATSRRDMIDSVCGGDRVRAWRETKIDGITLRAE